MRLPQDESTNTRASSALRTWDNLGWPGLGGALVALVGSLIAAVAVAVIAGLVLGPRALLNAGGAVVAAQFVMWIVWGLLSLIALSLLTRSGLGAEALRAFRLQRRDWAPLLGVFVMTQAIGVPLDALITHYGGPIFDPSTLKLLSTPVILVGAFTLVPVVEEIWMRGLVYGTLRSLGPWIAIAGSALVSAAVHFNLLQALGTLPAMLGLGWLRYHTGRLAPGMVVHGLNNLIAAAWLFWGGRV
jgi:membrane protease YdiL (CAAX protease family)